MKDTKETANEEKPRFHGAQVGDDVYDEAYGPGKITIMEPTTYPIKVKFKNCYESFTNYGFINLNAINPTLFYRKGEEKYLTERPEPEYEIDWNKVPIGTKVFTYLKKEDINDPYWNTDENIEIFMGYFHALNNPFWVFDGDDKETSSGWKYCKLAEPCKPEWKK